MDVVTYPCWDWNYSHIKTIDNDMELQENISSIAPAESLAPLGASSSAGWMMPKFRTRFLSPILSQVTWQFTSITCGVFLLCFFNWLHKSLWPKSLGPKSHGLFWNTPYCFPSDALLTSPCISVNTIVTSRFNTLVTSLNAAPYQPAMPTMLSEPMASRT